MQKGRKNRCPGEQFRIFQALIETKYPLVSLMRADIFWFPKTGRLAGGSAEAFAVEQSRRSDRLDNLTRLKIVATSVAVGRVCKCQMFRWAFSPASNMPL